MKWAAIALPALVAASPLNTSPVPRGLSTKDKCKLPFNTGDLSKAKDTWKKSGAADYFQDFVNKHGTKDWSDNFFKSVIAGGTQGGSTYDCASLNANSCDGPDDTACTSYDPPEAFFVHLAISNLNHAMGKLVTDFNTEALEAISTDINTIVKDYGTPPKDQTSEIFTAFMSVLTTLVGIDGTAGSVDDDKKPAGAGKIGSPLVALSGIMGMVNAGYDPKEVDPAQLQDDLTADFGDMFGDLMKGLNTSAQHIFAGEGTALDKLIGAIGQTIRPFNPNGWLLDMFDDGKFVDWEVVKEDMNTYRENTFHKMLELIFIKALKTENKSKYRILKHPKGMDVPHEYPDGGCGSFGCGSRATSPLTEDICNDNAACSWHKNNCVCFGYEKDRSTMAGGPYEAIIPDDDYKDFKKWVRDPDAALANGYDCGGADQDPPDNTFDPSQGAPEYFDCFWNLHTMDMSKGEYRGWTGKILPHED